MLGKWKSVVPILYFKKKFTQNMPTPKFCWGC